MAGADRAGRWVRVIALGVTATILTGTAHAVASAGTLGALLAATPRPVLGSAGVLSLTAIGALGWRRRPWWVVVATLTAVQLGQHLVLAGTGQHPHLGHSGGHSGATMLTAHALAAVTTAILLGYGERAVRLLLAWLGWPNLRFGPPAPAHPGPPRLSSARVWWPAAPAALSGGPSLRGPPGRSASS
ncbi:MAG: hypothetical protein WAL50_04765 [Kineosporiaceae bacterium]